MKRVLAAIAITALVSVVLFAQTRGDPSSESAAASSTGASSAPEASDRRSDPGSASEGSGSSDSAGPQPTVQKPPDLGPREHLSDISGWLNTTGSSFDEVRAEVTVVQFWTFGCSNCKATIPHLQELYARHGDRVEIIGVHAHEFERERDPDNVADAVEELGVTWPVALDTNKTNFRSWQGSPRFWPRTYVIDSSDRIRFDHIGEGQYDELSNTVDALLAGPQ